MSHIFTLTQTESVFRLVLKMVNKQQGMKSSLLTKQRPNSQYLTGSIKLTMTLGCRIGRRTLKLFLSKWILPAGTLLAEGNLVGTSHRLSIEIDIQSLFGLHVYSCTHWLRALHPPLPHLGSDTRALLVSHDRRHLFVTPLKLNFRHNPQAFPV